ncbi:DnaJ domain-containing protein [Candidatus Nitrospira bockiana]
MGPVKDYYAALGVSSTESLQGIHEAYRRLAKQYHPDRAGDQGTRKFQEIQEAYEVLSDPDKRKRYDAQADRPRPTRSVEPEPLVRSPRRPRFRGPEPLTRSFSPIEEVFEPVSFARCPFCGGRAGNFGFTCPFCSGSDELERALARLMAGYLRSFRGEWF